MTSCVDWLERWELGSEFSWCELPEGPLMTWPEESRWYMLGRHAIADLIRNTAQIVPRLWLPSYFCGEVAESCQGYVRLCEYKDDPSWPMPDWSSLRASAQDFVLAVNYFGVRSAEPWKEWRTRNPCILVEDHSQDPFSLWSLRSEADYAFASLRKTLPIPDGAILWSPRHLELPPKLAPDEGNWTGSALKLAAMFYKSKYLCGSVPANIKPRFRDLQLRGEQRLRASSISSISPYSYAYIADGVPKLWRSQRLANMEHLGRRLEKIRSVELLFKNWPEGAVPFAFPLVFKTTEERDACQSYLQKSKIYCPVHWICQTDDAQALDLSGRILSVPVDQRYDGKDMDRLADALLGFQNRFASGSEAKQGICAGEGGPKVEMQSIAACDRERFLESARKFFRYLNPNFIPQADWNEHYFDNIIQNPGWFLRWIVANGERAGYVLFGLENHKFLPRKNGTVYALFVEEEHRRKGIARICAEQVIRELQTYSPSKIELEIMADNHGAIAFWKSLGFRKVSERYVLVKADQ